MLNKTHNGNAWTFTMILAIVALVCVPVLLFQGGIFDGRELVDGHGNVVGRAYVGGPSSYADRYREASQLLIAGENAAAEQIYRELVDVEPNRPDAFIGLAGAQLRQFDLGEARTNYATALELDHTNPEALYGAGAVERMDGHPQEAKVFYRKALLASPDHLLSLYGMALVCGQLDERQVAKKYAKRYLELASDSHLNEEMLKILDAPD